MKKQIIALLAAAALAVSPLAAFADEAADLPQVNEPISATHTYDDIPTVVVNGRTVYFSDQQPVVVNDRILVPARGVFEALGAKVSWDGESQTARFDSNDNFVSVLVTINDPNMRVYTFTSVINSTEKKVELDVTPMIMNDRTMIPLRAISESFGANVDWNGAAYTATISDKDFTDAVTSPAESGKKPVTLALSADKTEVAPGEEVILSISASGLADLDTYLAGVTAALCYDNTAFAFGGYTAMMGGEPMAGGIGASNPDYLGDSVKANHVTTQTPDKAKDGVVMQFRFVALENAGSASFAISDRYTMEHAADTYLTLNNKTLPMSSCIIDTTPVTVTVK